MTTSELEALVGHLFIVDGRHINAPSPGAIATPAPRRTARGRDADTLFALISLSEDQRRPASFYEGLTEEIASTYFRTAGSVTAALRKAIDSANTTLLKNNAGRDERVSVGLACAILRGQELYLAAVGPARCFLVGDSSVERLPSGDELREGAVPLGVDREPDARFYHREVQPGNFLILADASLDHLRGTTLQQAVESGEVNSALNNLRGVAGESAAGVVIKFVAPLPEGVAEPEPQPRRPAPREQPQTAAPPARPLAEAPVEASQPKAALPFFRRVGRDTALGLARATDGTKTLVEKMLPEDEIENPLAQRLHLSITMQIGVTVAVAVLIALLTTFVYRFRGQSTEYARLVRGAQSEIELARAGADDQASARPHWEDAISLLEQAATIRSPGPETVSLRDEALAALDTYDHVTRITPTLLREYQPGAVLNGPIVQGLNLYLIDTTHDILYREDLDEGGTSLVNREPQVITRQGDLAGDQVVSGLIDLIWMEDGGAPQRNVLAVLSRNGLLITYSPSWDVTAVLLPGYEAWSDPRAIAIYDRDLYILDAGANEIWRYEAGADAYAGSPQRYFTDIEPELADAIDMAIDTNGNVYVLHAGGRISKYFFGRPEPFEFEGLPQPLARPSALFLNLSLFDRAFFIADPGGGRLYATAPTGVFLANYKDADNTIFNALSGVYNQDRPPYVYVTAGGRLYYFSRP